MTVYIGQLGRMIKIPYVTDVKVSPSDPYTFRTTIEGTPKAHRKPRTGRTWGLETEHFRPNEVGVLASFVDGAWGPGPFVFVSVDAKNTNLLTPAVALCDPAANTFSQGGPVELPDGTWMARSLLGDGVANVLFGSVRSPLLVGKPVSAGAWVQGAGAATRVNWYDVAGAFIGSAVSPITSSGGWVWSTLTATPPVGAAGAIVSGLAASKATGPVLVWGTVKPTSWSPGEGCAKAVVHGYSRDLVATFSDLTFSNISFTVTEVG